MPVLHFCQCGEVSQQNGVWLHAVPCPHCGLVAPCEPHTPGRGVMAARRAAHAGPQTHTVEAHGVIEVGGGAGAKPAKKAAAKKAT